MDNEVIVNPNPPKTKFYRPKKEIRAEEKALERQKFFAHDSELQKEDFRLFQRAGRNLIPTKNDIQQLEPVIAKNFYQTEFKNLEAADKLGEEAHFGKEFSDAYARELLNKQNDKQVLEQTIMKLPIHVRSEIFNKRDRVRQFAITKKEEKQWHKMLGPDWMDLVNPAREGTGDYGIDLEYDISSKFCTALAHTLSFLEEDFRPEVYTAWTEDDTKIMQENYRNMFQNYRYLTYGDPAAMVAEYDPGREEQLDQIYDDFFDASPFCLHTDDFEDHLYSVSDEDMYDGLFRQLQIAEANSKVFWTMLSSYFVEEKMAKISYMFQEAFSSIQAQDPAPENPLFLRNKHHHLVRVEIIGLKKLKGNAYIRSFQGKTFFDYDYDIAMIWHASFSQNFGAEKINPLTDLSENQKIYRGYIRILNFNASSESQPFRVYVDSPWINTNQQWMVSDIEDLEKGEDHQYDITGKRVSALMPYQQKIEDLLKNQVTQEIEKRADLLLRSIRHLFRCEQATLRRTPTKQPHHPLLKNSLEYGRKIWEKKVIAKPKSWFGSITSNILIGAPVTFALYWSPIPWSHGVHFFHNFVEKLVGMAQKMEWRSAFALLPFSHI